jgi:hypothetical protein
VQQILLSPRSSTGRYQILIGDRYAEEPAYVIDHQSGNAEPLPITRYVQKWVLWAADDSNVLVTRSYEGLQQLFVVELPSLHLREVSRRGLTAPRPPLQSGLQEWARKDEEARLDLASVRWLDADVLEFRVTVHCSRYGSQPCLDGSAVLRSHYVTLRISAGAVLEDASPQDFAVGALRTLNTAAVSYSAAYGSYPKTLADLGPGKPLSERAAHLIDAEMASGTRRGYLFTYAATETDKDGNVLGYAITADPVENKSGLRFFFTDQSGVIRFSTTRRATAASPPITLDISQDKPSSPDKPAAKRDYSDLVQQLLTRAEEQFKQGQYQAALGSCEQALQHEAQNQQARALKQRIQQTMKILGIE